LNKLARILRKRRIENGALTLASPEVKFKTSEENEDPIDMGTFSLIVFSFDLVLFAFLLNLFTLISVVSSSSHRFISQ
jgi:exosome complex exonuclease DIS3/RRP44